MILQLARYWSVKTHDQRQSAFTATLTPDLPVVWYGERSRIRFGRTITNHIRRRRRRAFYRTIYTLVSTVLVGENTQPEAGRNKQCECECESERGGAAQNIYDTSVSTLLVGENTRPEAGRNKTV